MNAAGTNARTIAGSFRHLTHEQIQNSSNSCATSISQVTLQIQKSKGGNLLRIFWSVSNGIRTCCHADYLWKPTNKPSAFALLVFEHTFACLTESRGFFLLDIECSAV